MPEFEYVTLDVFTDRKFGGNQLAVFPDARGIPEELLLTIAREFNYSETTFCYPPVNPAHAANVRIFTPGAEVPFAGHPTVGTAIALVASGKFGSPSGESRIVLEEKVGPIPVTVRIGTDGSAFAQFSVAKLPEVGPPAPSRSMLAKILSINTEDVLSARYAPEPVSCGLPFLMVGVTGLDALERARVRFEKWETTLQSAWAPDLFVFAKDPAGGDTHYRARCFVPSCSVPEDPATGSANACFAGYLAMRERAKDGAFRWTVDQGVEMGRASRIEIEADKAAGSVTAIRVGGAAVQVMRGTLHID